MKNKSVLLLTLKTFSATGGIEQVGRNLAKVFSLFLEEKSISNFSLFSMYDNTVDEKYIEQNNFKGFYGSKTKFILQSAKKGLSSQTLILSHINLLIVAYLVRIFQPGKKIILLAHGIEIWTALPTWKIKFLSKIEIWAVSNFTSNQIQKVHKIPAENIQILNNSLDFQFKFKEKIKSVSFLNKYNLSIDDKVILTICRLSSEEKYKGYDIVIKSLKEISKTYPNLSYFIAGKADKKEELRVKQLIKENELEGKVILTGYVDENELANFYQLADVFIMPSQQEGFGLVYIEAAANGCNVIAGNLDGSADALLNGELGVLVSPTNQQDIELAILNSLEYKLTAGEICSQQDLVSKHFSFEIYKKKVENLLLSTA